MSWGHFIRSLTIVAAAASTLMWIGTGCGENGKKDSSTRHALKQSQTPSQETDQRRRTPGAPPPAGRLTARKSSPRLPLLHELVRATHVRLGIRFIAV